VLGPTPEPTFPTPTFSSSASPSATPTVPSSATPSLAPAPSPPSPQPILQPSRPPTFLPSSQPSGQPSAAPTRPTLAPTAVPTFAPISPQNSQSVDVQGTCQFDNVQEDAGGGLSDTTKDSICDAAQKEAKADGCDVTSAQKKGTRRMLEEIALEQIHLEGTSSWIIEFVLKYYLVNHPGVNATYIAEKSQQALINSFQTGAFQTALREAAIANNATQLFNVTATNLTTSATVTQPTTTTSSSHSVSLTTGQVAGIVIGSVIGAILLFVLVLFLVREKRSESRINQASRYAASSSLDRNLGDLVVVDEHHSPTRLGVARHDNSGYIYDTVTIHVDHDIERQVVGGGESTDLTDGFLQIRL
jgi:hypothetical protein